MIKRMADVDGTVITEKVENVTMYKLNKKNYTFKKNGVLKKVSFQFNDGKTESETNM